MGLTDMQHINIRVESCLECPFAETDEPLHAATIGEWPVRCNQAHTAAGTISSAAKGISPQCPFPKSTDVKDALAD